MTIRIGIDFGGTKIEAAALAEDGMIVARRRVPNPGNYDAAISELVSLVAFIEAECGERCTIGIGTPGAASPHNRLLRNANSTYLNGRPFERDISAAMAREVRLANDANCFALSEAIDGAAAGWANVFGLILGTGCGGGLVIDGRIVGGSHGIAGEIGHMPLPWPIGEELPPPTCWCGQSGCFESWVSGTGFQRAFAVQTGRLLSAQEIVLAARGGDVEAKKALTDFVDRLGRGLAIVANLIDPDAIVVGGACRTYLRFITAYPRSSRDTPS